MSENKSYRNLADIRNMANRQPLVQQEYRNYDEYMAAQKLVHDHMFQQPAATCQLCGYPMDYNGHKLSEREKKWSVHDVCNEKMSNMLDRKTGVARERQTAEKQMRRRAQRNPRNRR